MKDVKVIYRIIKKDFEEEVKGYLEKGYTVENCGLLYEDRCKTWWVIMIYE